MKALKLWGWLLFVCPAVLFIYGWISGEFNGHGIAKMDDMALMLTIFSLVCLLLAITVMLVVHAIKARENR